MKLNMFERMAIREILPTEQNFAGMKEVRKAHEICAMTAEEMKECVITDPDGRQRIDPDKGLALIKELPFTEWITTMIREKLQELNKNHELEDKYLTLYEKFVEFYR